VPYIQYNNLCLFHGKLQFQAHQTITPSRSTSDVSTTPPVHAAVTANTDTPNKKKRFAKLRIRGSGKASDRPKVWTLKNSRHFVKVPKYPLVNDENSDNHQNSLLSI